MNDWCFGRNLDLPKKFDNLCKEFKYYEWNLSDLEFPSHMEINSWVKEIEKEVGIIGFRSHGKNCLDYKGFSLVYNPNFVGQEQGIYHQTLGDKSLQSSYNQISNMHAGGDTSINCTNSYYDTYGFTHKPPLVEKLFDPIFSKIEGAILRSRVSYLYSEHFNYDIPTKCWHVDETGYQLVRLIIPVKTSNNFVIRIDGDDELGNEIHNMEFSPELGKVYTWNNRIPHQMAPLEKKVNDDPRIYVIIGLSPWFNYDYDTNQFYKNENWGYPIDLIMQHQLFIK